MELMSPLLLYTVLALLPQTLAMSKIKKSNLDIKFNNTVMIQEKPSIRKKLLLNLNGPSLVNKVSELQSVFVDRKCTNCTRCMERAIKAHKIHSYIITRSPSTEEIQVDLIVNQDSNTIRRDRRESPKTVNKSVNKLKAKRNKFHKTMTVTKYNVDGDIYALKIKEADQKDDTKASVMNCRVYKVKQSFPCDSPEGESIIASAQSKMNKKNTKTTEALTVATEMSQSHKSPTLAKRDVDSSRFSENYMPSIEEMY